MRCKFIAWAAVALIGAAPFAGARADVLFNNTSQPIDPTYCGDGPSYCGGDAIVTGGAGPIAASFSTGSSAVSLSYLSISVMLEALSPTDLGSITASLWSDSGGSGPLSQVASLGTIQDSSLTTSYSLISLSPSGSYTLASNEMYWVELSSVDSSALWGYTGTSTGVGTLNEYSWNQYASPPVVTLNNGGATYIMDVAVPEPASLGLVAFGLIALLGARKLRGAQSGAGPKSIVV